MKKLKYISMALGLSIFFVACGAKTPVEPITPSKATTTTPKDIKITYTDKLAYLPSYNGVKPTEYTAASKTKLATVKYTIKNTTDAKVYQDYENILKKDGWTIAEGKKYYSISSKKDTHIANILIQKAGKDVILLVISK